MKIEGPGKASGVKGPSKTKKNSGDSAFGAMMEETGEAEASASTSRPASVNALDALLTLQAAEGTSEEASKRAKKRGEELLNHLDQIKMGLLTGSLPKSTLQELARTIATHRDHMIDPKLAEILDDIDLRAQVELAKLEK